MSGWPVDGLDYVWAAARLKSLIDRCCVEARNTIARIDESGSHVLALYGECNVLLTHLAHIVTLEPDAVALEAKILDEWRRRHERPGEDLSTLRPTYYALRDGFTDVSAWCSAHYAEIFPEQPPGVAAPDYPALVEPRRTELLGKLNALTAHMAPPGA